MKRNRKLNSCWEERANFSEFKKKNEVYRLINSSCVCVCAGLFSLVFVAQCIFVCQKKYLSKRVNVFRDLFSCTENIVWD